MKIGRLVVVLTPVGKPAPGTDFFESQRTLADTAAKRFDEQAEASRKRADIWGKGILGVGTTLVTALGIGKVADILPKADLHKQFIAAVFLIIAVAAIMVIGFRLSRVSAPIVMRTSLSDMTHMHRDLGIKPRELKTIRPIYDRFNDLNGVEDLTEYTIIPTIIEATLTSLADRGVTADEIAGLTQARRTQYREDITAQLIESTEKIKVTRENRESASRPTFNRTKVVTTYVAYTFDNPDLASQKAALVRAEARYVMNNALAAVVRRRAVDATTDWLSMLTLAVIPVAVLLAVIVTSTANGQQDNRREAEREKACSGLVAVLDDRQLALSKYLLAICGQT